MNVLFRRLRSWLLVKLAGRSTVIINARISGVTGVELAGEGNDLLVGSVLADFPNAAINIRTTKPAKKPKEEQK